MVSKKMRERHFESITIHGKVLEILKKLRADHSDDEGELPSYNSIIRRLMKKSGDWQKYQDIETDEE
jgi:hypothetical protein